MVDDDPAVAGAAAVLGLGGANKISVTILLEFVFSVETFLAHIFASRVDDGSTFWGISTFYVDIPFWGPFLITLVVIKML